MYDKKTVLKNHVNSYNKMVEAINEVVPSLIEKVKEYENINVTIKNGDELSKKFKNEIYKILESLPEKIQGLISYRGYSLDINFKTTYKDSKYGASYIQRYIPLACIKIGVNEYFVHDINENFIPIEKVTVKKVVNARKKAEKLKEKVNVEIDKLNKLIPYEFRDGFPNRIY